MQIILIYSFSGNHSIIFAYYASIMLNAYYAENYAGIIGAGLLSALVLAWNCINSSRCLLVLYTGAPGSFQCLMDKVMHGFRFVTTYINDLLVHSKNVEEPSPAASV